MIYQQDIAGKRLTPLAGIGLILLIVLSIVAAGLLERFIAQRTGFQYGSMAVWLLVGLEAVLVARMSTQSQRYVLTGSNLIMMQLHGENPRILFDIPVSSVLAVGPEDEVFRRHGNGQAYDKAITRGCDIPRSALAYRKDDKVHLVVFQPDEKLLRLLKDAINESADENLSALE